MRTLRWLTLLSIASGIVGLEADDSAPPELVLMSSHAGEVSSLEFSHSGKWLLSQGRDDGRAITWNLSTRRPSRVTAKAISMRFALGADTVLALSEHTLGHLSPATSSDLEDQLSSPPPEARRRVISPMGDWEAFVGAGNSFAIRKLPSGNSTYFRPVDNESGTVRRLLWSGNLAIAQFTNGELSVVDGLSQTLIRTKSFGSHFTIRSGTSEPSHSLLLLSDGKNVLLYDPIDDRISFRAETSDSSAVAVDPTGHYLVLTTENSGREVLLIHNLKTGERKSLLLGAMYPKASAVSPDGNMVALALDAGSIVFADLVEGRIIVPNVARPQPIKQIGLRWNSFFEVGEGTIHLWDLYDGLTHRGIDLDIDKTSALVRFATSENGQASAVYGEAGIIVARAAPAERRKIRFSKSQVLLPRVGISNDAKHVLWSEENKDGDEMLRLTDLADPLCLSHGLNIGSVRFAFNAKSSLLAVSCGTGTVRVFDLISGHFFPGQTESTSNSPVAFDSYSGLLVTVVQKEIRLLDPRTFEVKVAFSAAERPTRVASTNLDLLAVAESDCIELFTRTSGHVLTKIALKGDSARALALTPTGVLITGGDDGLLRFWDAVDGGLLATALSTSDQDWIAITPNGFFDASGEGINWIAWREAGSNMLFPGDLFFNDYYLPGLLARIYRAEQLPNQNNRNLSSFLKTPGLRALVAQGSANVVRNTQGAVSLCLANKPDTLKFFLDGRQESWNESDFEFDPGVPGCRYRKRLSAPAQLEVVNLQELTSKPFTTPWDGSKQGMLRGSRLHVVAIGAGEYRVSENGLRRIAATIEGEKEIRKFFESERNNKNSLFGNIEIWPSLGGEATRSRILWQLHEVAQEAKEEDTVFVYLGGHGAVPAGQGLFFWLPLDARTNSLDDLRQTAISSLHLADWLRSLNARRVFIVVDTCQSGGALEAVAKAAESRAGLAVWNETHSASPAIDNRIGIHLLASATPLQLAQMPETGPSLLVKELLHVLGLKRIEDTPIWVTALVESVKRASVGWPREQSPVTRSIGIDFPIH